MSRRVIYDIHGIKVGEIEPEPYGTYKKVVYDEDRREWAEIEESGVSGKEIIYRYGKKWGEIDNYTGREIVYDKHGREWGEVRYEDKDDITFSHVAEAFVGPLLKGFIDLFNVDTWFKRKNEEGDEEGDEEGKYKRELREFELSPVIIEEGKDRYSLYSYHYNKRIIKNLTTTDWRYLRTEYDPIIIMWKDKYKFSLHSHRHDNGINLPKDMWHRIVDKSRDFEQAFYVVEQFLENRGIKETVPEGYLRGVIKKLYEEEKLYEKQIRKRAYEIWERKGRPTQSKEEQERDWFEAKKEIEAN